ncbi:hypothetical protein [Aquimarina pacifica]|uniref:hypothetical protein n=1 Tax=Aquimarina pacifica TaxID=1296415 RepID=UPI000472B8A4|nr:hypothetical protein [Aquimarina pacifica]
MKLFYKYLTVILFILLAITTIVAFIFFEDQLPSLDLTIIEPSTIIGVLGYVSIIMLVVEQSIEIFVFDANKKKKEASKKRIQKINAILEKMDPEALVSEIDEQIILLTKEQKENKRRMVREREELKIELEQQGLKRQRRIRVISFIMGLLISFSGIRILTGALFNSGVLFDVEEGGLGMQATILQSIDIILTAAIIAGGSDRVHSLIKRAKVALNPYEE